MIGSGIAAIVCVATGTTANAIGVGGIPGILSIQPKYMASFAICMAIALAVPFLLTTVVGGKRLKADRIDETSGDTDFEVHEKEENKTPLNQLTAFLSGKAIPLSEVGDGVFSEGIMGDGMAIIPENDTLYAPADSQVAVMMPKSRHACGLKLENGMEVLLHIGIDTVGMNGDGFEYLVQEGQKVSAGTPLIKFNRAKIKAAGHPDVTICVITDEGNAKDIQFNIGMHVKEKETVVAKFK